MAISQQTQLVLDAYAVSVGGKQDPIYLNVLDVIQHSPQLEQALNRLLRMTT